MMLDRITEKTATVVMAAIRIAMTTSTRVWPALILILKDLLPIYAA
jgi:hypothetical protein